MGACESRARRRVGCFVCFPSSARLHRRRAAGALSQPPAASHARTQPHRDPPPPSPVRARTSYTSHLRDAWLEIKPEPTPRSNATEEIDEVSAFVVLLIVCICFFRSFFCFLSLTSLLFFFFVEEMLTFPSDAPSKRIDYVMMRGENAQVRHSLPPPIPPPCAIQSTPHQHVRARALSLSLSHTHTHSLSPMAF